MLHVSDIHRFGQIGRARDSDRSLADFFRGPLARRELSIVAECTEEQLSRLEQDAPAFAALFTRIVIAPATPAETFRVLVEAARALEPSARVWFTPFALRTVLELGAALMPAGALPGQAVGLLSQVARVNEGAPDDAPPMEIDSAVVVERIASLTGLPRALVTPDAKLPVADVRRQLAAQVMGQDEAVDAVVDLVSRIKAGLVDPRRPYGVYLFTGPTGTGKTELARCLAEYLYGSASRLTRFDMSELGTPDACARLVGDAYHPEGLLTRAAIEQPMSVLLLDEIDKAHPSVHNLLLALFEDARVTDAAGNTASFAHMVVIMTSNLGAQAREPLGFVSSPDAIKSDVARAVREFFPPELFNRIDRVVPFAPLSEEIAVNVAEKELGKLLSRRGLGDRNVFVQGTRAVARRVAALAFQERDGARSLKRFLEDRIGTRLSELLASTPSAVMRMLWLFDAPGADGGFVVEDEPLVEARPLSGVRYALDGLETESLEALRARLPALLPELAEVAERALSATTERVYAEELQSAAQALTSRIEAACGLGRDRYEEHDEDDRYEDFETGRGDSYTRHRVRKSRLAPAQHDAPLTRAELLGMLARSAQLARLAGDPGAHGVVIEVLRVAAPPGLRFAPDAGSEAAPASLVRWLTLAYAEAGTVSDHAIASGDTLTFGRGKPALVTALSAPATLVVLRLEGLGVRDTLAGEDGTHVWQPLAATPEIVRVRVLPDDRSAREVATEHVAKKRAFDAAVLAGATGAAPPENPARLSPMVRRLRFEPPRRALELAPLEVEDYVLAHAMELRVAGVGEAIARLMELRMSRRPVRSGEAPS